MPKTTIEVNDAEHATILAALRMWQDELVRNHGRIISEELYDLANNGGTVTTLDDSQIHALCERINTREPPR